MSRLTPPDTSRAQRIGQIARTADRQSSSLANSAVVDEAFIRVFNEQFAGLPILDDQEKIRVVSQLANTIRHERKRQLETVIEIGRAFCRTEDSFTREEWHRLLAATQALFGMSKNTACMYRAVARAVDAGRIPRDLCPPSFSTAYTLTTYTDSQLDLAREQGLVRPDVTRRELVVFKKRLLSKKRSRSGRSSSPLSSLLKKRERLYKELEKLEVKIAEAERQAAVSRTMA
ncbi:hypothetical protein DTI93_09260 [Parasaccharibacter sp. TMW 2.1884]|uniref:hypothetical protein n=1 Tax=Parasaccharibacter sp. TMW 2.1884 TaxID=2267834 RepID=UPI002012DD30|nr:hypothetical protein [Parasaccharibacter sp. TMW 2.1884]MCL1512569.1 hypothetical protein [Parasaccharibacter sp. TMW 2.1884]